KIIHVRRKLFSSGEDDAVVSMRIEKFCKWWKDLFDEPRRIFLIRRIPVLGPLQNCIHVNRLRAVDYSGVLELPVGPAISGVDVNLAVGAGEVKTVHSTGPPLISGNNIVAFRLTEGVSRSKEGTFFCRL